MGTVENEKVLVYLGPSLPVDEARKILPEAVYRPPASQGDILSDCINLSPSRIILIDGCFREHLSPWHKEIVYALQHPGVKGVYGAASIGAVRAAELEHVGMIGLGKIFEWYRDGLTEDDADVALTYSEIGGKYLASSVPLVDIIAGSADYSDQELADSFRQMAREVHFTERTTLVCQELWQRSGGEGIYPSQPQKMLDAQFALSNFASYQTEPEIKLNPDHLSSLFQAMFERDRKLAVQGQQAPAQHIEAYTILHHPEYERVLWDCANQELSFILCNLLKITVTMEEVERENYRFQARVGIRSQQDFEAFLSANGWTRPEYDSLVIKNSRIRKLQHALSVTKTYRRNTQALLDYLRTYQGFDYWAKLALELEAKIAQAGVEEWFNIDLDKPAFAMLDEHMAREGLDVKMSCEEYLVETGFMNTNELSIALQRINSVTL